MIYLLEEATTKFDDSFTATFYYIAVLALLIGVFWTYFQVFVRGRKKSNTDTKENTIYQNTEDIIEEADKEYYYNKKNKNNSKNYNYNYKKNNNNKNKNNNNRNKKYY